jgi:drug/metabolite transporter (DMT)-like permease
MYIRCSLLLHVSAAHGPSSGNIYYLGVHCTVHFVFCTYRHIAVIIVNLFHRIFLSYFSPQPFQCSFLVSFTCICFSAVCSCTLYTYISVSNATYLVLLLSLYVPALYGHYQVHVYIAKIVPLYVKITYCV